MSQGSSFEKYDLADIEASLLDILTSECDGAKVRCLSITDDTAGSYATGVQDDLAPCLDIWNVQTFFAHYHDDLTDGRGVRYSRILALSTSKSLSALALGTLAWSKMTTDGLLIVVDDFHPDNGTRKHLGCGFVERYFLETLQRCGFVICMSPEIRAASHRWIAGTRKVFCFRRTEPRWRVADALYFSSEPVRALFGRVFGQQMTERLWAWKYAEGRGCGVSCWQGAELVAHYGVVIRNIRFFGKPSTAIEICDVMVAPAARRSLSRKGPFFLTAATTAEQHLLDHAIGFGFPNRRAMRVAERLSLYVEVGRIFEIVWRARSLPPMWWCRSRLLCLPDDVTWVDGLWLAMARDLTDQLVGVRDAAYLRQRYFNHPEYAYRVELITHRITGVARGVLVLREHGDTLELLDMVGRRRHWRELVEWARFRAHALGKKELHCWASDHLAAELAGHEGVIKDPDVSIPMSCWGPSPDPEMVRDRWWLMGGDTDFR